MNNTYLIGAELFDKDIEEALVSKSHRLAKFSSLKQVTEKNRPLPDLIVIGNKQSSSPSFRDFIKTFKDIPMIVVCHTHSFSGFRPWTKMPFAFPVCNPTRTELFYFVSRALSAKKHYLELLALRTESEHIRKELVYYEAVSKTLTSTLDLNEILAAIMKEAKKLIHAESWSVLLVDEESQELYFSMATGKKNKRDTIKKAKLKIGEGIAGWVAKEGVPIVVPDVSVDPRFCPKIDAETLFTTKTLICVPIKSKDKTLGVLEIINKVTKEPFTKDDLNLVLKLVDHAAIAVERASIYHKMADLSVTDDLTKLFNSRYMNRTLDVEISRSNRYKTSLSLIFMDIDYFKSVNDNYGHLVGSKLLVEMGQVLIGCLRSLDIVARYGGDEFVIVLPQTPPKPAFLIAERIRKKIEDNVFLKKDGYAFKITASFGVASYPENAHSKEELLRLSDEAMYRVKNKTRNGVYAIV